MITNRHDLPAAIVRALENDPYESEGADATVTSLHNPPRMNILTRERRGEIAQDASELVNVLLGQAVHVIIERAAQPPEIAEKRFYADVLGWTIGAKPDLYNPETGIIEDWKVPSIWGIVVGDALKEYEHRLNTIAYVLRQNGQKVTKLRIVAIFKDWDQREARNKEDYPKKPIMAYELPIWPDAEAEAYVKHLVQRQQEAIIDWERDGILPDCSLEERWESAPRFAVMKGSNKRASKVCDSMAEAQDYIRLKGGNDLSVETRPAQAKRCMHYCPAREVCSVGQSWAEAAENAY